MLESIEGKRGLPRHKPPFPSQVGLFGRPTLINNVETLFWVRDIVERGPEWFTSQGRERPHRGCAPSRCRAASRTRRQARARRGSPCGNYRRVLRRHGGRPCVQGYLPGGASGGILPASMADIPLDFGTLEQHGCLSARPRSSCCPSEIPCATSRLNIMRFFEDESCGQCTPCRVGTEKAVRADGRAGLGRGAPRRDLAVHDATPRSVDLGQAAMNPVKSVLKHFRDDIAVTHEDRPHLPKSRAGITTSRLDRKHPFLLDGRRSRRPGETIWQVAKRAGIDIPHLCYSS